MLTRLLAALLLVPAGLLAQTPLIGIWQFDETAGLTAADSGPHGNSGALFNFTNDPQQWIAGMSGNALAFDGSDDYVEMQTNVGLPFYTGRGDTFSVCLWVNGSATSDDRVLSLGSSTSDTPLFTLGTGSVAAGHTGKLRVYVRNDQGVSSDRNSAATVFDNTWHHIAYVETSGQAYLYVDGVRDTANFDDRFATRGTRGTQHGTYTLDKVALGAVVRPSTCCHWQGAVDSLQIYGFALNEADVNTVMTGGSPGACRASVGEYGVGCGPGPLDLYAAGQAVIGSSGFLFTMRGGPANAAAMLGIGAGRVAPLDLAGFGFPGCSLYPANVAFVQVGMLNAYGSSGAIPLAIPNIPSLACTTIAFQGVGIGASGAAFSNAIVAMLGM